MILYGNSLPPLGRKVLAYAAENGDGTRGPRTTACLDAILARPGFAVTIAGERRFLVTRV